MNDKAKQINLDFIIQVTENNKEEIKAFIKDVHLLKKEILPEMNVAASQGNYIILKEGSHKLKSAIKIFGSGILEEKLGQIEKAAEDNSEVQIHKLIEEINHIFPQWDKELENEFNNL